MKKFYLNKLLLVLAAIVVSFFNIIPVSAVPDFYSDSNIQFYDPTACDPNGGSNNSSINTDSAGGDLVGGSNGEKAFNYFVEKGLSKQGAAGIVGNLMRETGGDTFNITPTPPPSGYHGIVQWDAGRWSNLNSFADSIHQSPDSLDTQLQFTWEEIHETSYSSVIPKLKNATNPQKAARDFNRIYEIGAGADQRATNAQTAYDAFKDNGAAADTSSATSGSGNSCCGSSSPSPSDLSPGSGSPAGTTFPNLDPAAMSSAIDKYIEQTVPSSPYKGLGATIVASSKVNNINPFMVVSIAQMETSIGTMGNASQTNSAFNRRASSSQPSAGGWYKYSSFKASVDSSAAENQGQHRGDETTYLRESGFYDKGLKSGKIYDIISVYAPAGDGNNVANYVKNMKSWMKKMTKLAGGSSATTTPTASSPSDSATCSCSDPSSTSVSGSNINDKLDALANANGGKTKISVSTIDGGTKGDSGGDTQMPTRSSYKIYTAYATLRAIEDGKISWSTRVWGSKSVKDTMEEMIVYSRNAAAEALRLNPTIGLPSKVTSMLQNDLGLSSKTVMGGGSSTSAAGSNSKSTANDYVKFLTLLKKKSLKGVKEDTSYETLIGFMKRATTDGGSARDGIVAGVGAGTEVADKPGWAPGSVDPASNDVGIVYLSGKPYVVAILTDKPSKWDGVAKIAKAVNDLISGTSSAGCSDGAAAGDAAQTAINYAWPRYHPAPYTSMRPAYKEAVRTAEAANVYVGSSGTAYAGIDCNGFVNLVMRNSGVDSNFEGSGGTVADAEYPYLKNSGKYTTISPRSTADLQPGDIWVISSQTHTLIYVGNHSDFNGIYASSSTGGGGGSWRAPMADSNGALYTGGTWFRKK